MPYLSGKPLQATITSNAEVDRIVKQVCWRPLPRAGDSSLITCTMEACLWVLRRKGFSPVKASLLSLLIKVSHPAQAKGVVSHSHCRHSGN